MTQSIKPAALRYLAQREHSIAELKSKLKRKGYSSQDIESLVPELVAEDLLNEYRYAEVYCRSRSVKGYGPNAIKFELLSKQINESIIYRVLEEANFDWDQNLKKVFAKKYSSVDLLEHQAKAKCWRFLANRGFTQGQISSFFKNELVD